MFLRLTFVAVLLGLAAAFVVQNSEPIEVELLAWSFRTSQILVLLLAALLGILVWEVVRAILKRDRRA